LVDNYVDSNKKVYIHKTRKVRDSYMEDSFFIVICSNPTMYETYQILDSCVSMNNTPRGGNLQGYMDQLQGNIRYL